MAPRRATKSSRERSRTAERRTGRRAPADRAERCLVLSPELRGRAAATPRAPRRASPRRSAWRGRSGSTVVACRESCGSAAPRPATLIGSGAGRARSGSSSRPKRSSSSSSIAPLSPVQQRNLETRLEVQGHRPHRPDPRDLRRARAHPRRPAPGRARRAQLPAQPAGADLDPSRAPARRLRLPRRPRRKPDRDRPPPDRRAHRADQARARGR